MLNELAASFAIDVLRPERIGPEVTPLPRPEFVADVGMWNAMFDFLTNLGALTPAMVAIDRAPWRDELPEAIRLRVEERVRRDRMILVGLDYELDSALFVLIGAEIPFVVVNDMDLGHRYYPERQFRAVSGIELLIPPAQYPEALRVLGRADYRVLNENARTTHFRRRAGAPTVQLLRGLRDGDTEADVGGIHERSLCGAIPGLPANYRALSHADALVHLIRQAAAGQLPDSPVWLNDIHFIISNDDFRAKGDWDWIVWALAQHRALGAAWFTFNFLASEWGTEVPAVALSGFEQKVGSFRKVLLARMAKPRTWYPLQGRGAPLKLRSRLLLNDNPFRVLFGRLDKREITPT